MEQIFPLDAAMVITAEEAVLAQYRSALKPYAERFAACGANMNIFIARTAYGKDMDGLHEIDAGYKAYVACELTDNCGRIIESQDRDMYMDFAWPLSVCTNGQVHVFADVDGDAYDLMQACGEYFAHPY